MRLLPLDIRESHRFRIPQRGEEVLGASRVVALDTRIRHSIGYVYP